MLKKLYRFIKKRDIFRVPIQLKTYNNGKYDSEYGSMIGFIMSILAVITMLSLTYFQIKSMLNHELDEDKTIEHSNAFDKYNEFHFKD